MKRLALSVLTKERHYYNIDTRYGIFLNRTIRSIFIFPKVNITTFTAFK